MEYWRITARLVCTELVEVLIEGKRHFDIELFHYDFASTVGEAPVLILKLLKYIPRERQIRGSNLMYIGEIMVEELRTQY